jgi:NAD+ kinase
MTIAVYARNTKDNLPVYVEKLAAILQKEKVKLIIYQPYYQYLLENFGFPLSLDTYISSEDLIAKADFVVCFGGDGTMLETLALIRKSGIPVLGVNTGRLGFLSSVAKEDLEKALTLLIKEKFTLDKRDLLELTGNEMLFRNVNYALNEFTIHKKDTSAMIHIDTYIDGVFLNSYFADGLIVATPTGSTAYSLSCNGPIMVPDSENFILTPIAPHNLNVRPIVISNRKVISFKVSGRNEGYNISLDSRTATVNSTTEIQIRKAKFKFNLITFEGQHFFETLRNKLLWGIDRRPK